MNLVLDVLTAILLALDQFAVFCMLHRQQRVQKKVVFYEIFDFSQDFYESFSPADYTINPFRICTKIRGDIRK
jgi:hypothetical protein